MGSLTDAKIAAWQKHAGITPATGRRAELLKEMSQAAFELIKIIEMERLGIRDGDGGWYGSDPLTGRVREISELLDRLQHPGF